MSTKPFIEVVFPPGSLSAAGFEGRDEIEDPLHEKLWDANFGEVVGGGGGTRGSNLDIEITASVPVEDAIAFLRTALAEIGAPDSTYMVVRVPEHRRFALKTEES